MKTRPSRFCTCLRTTEVAVVLALVLAACSKNEASPEGATSATGSKNERGLETEPSAQVVLSKEAIERSGIQVSKATKHLLIPRLIAPARVAFDAEAIAHVGSPLIGRVTDIRVRLGESVESGAPLLVVESPDLGEAQSDYLQKSAAADAALPGVELAKSALERGKALYEKSQGISLTEVGKREVEYHAADSVRLAAKTAATAAENRLHLLGFDQASIAALKSSGEVDPHYQIKAPIGGQIVERNVTLGELVRPEIDALLVVADLRTLWVLADVPEARLSDLALHAKARVFVGSDETSSCEGAVEHIAAAVDPSTRCVRVRIEVQGGDLALRPGMFAQVAIDVAAKSAIEPVLAVPDSAVQTVNGSPAVFVRLEGAENTFALRPIRVGRLVGGFVPVLLGLVEGEDVVVEGSFVLKADLSKGTAEED